MITVHPEGDWQTFRLKLTASTRDLPARANTELGKYVFYVYKFLYESIRLRRFNFAPLARSTLDRRRLTRNFPILINTAGYISDIRVIKDREGWRIGPASARYQRIASMLEFGTSRMPPRPHWAPTMDFARRNVGQVAGAVINGLAIRR